MFRFTKLKSITVREYSHNDKLRYMQTQPLIGHLFYYSTQLHCTDIRESDLFLTRLIHIVNELIFNETGCVGIGYTEPSMLLTINIGYIT